MRFLILIAVAVVAAAAGFAAGRGTAPSHPAARVHPGTYNAGYEDAFSGFDGGWILGDPYIVILGHGSNGTTYRFARRWPMLPGHEYRSCPEDFICSRPTS